MEREEEKKVVEKINKMYNKVIMDRLVNGYWRVGDWEDNWEKDKEFYDRWKVGMPFWKKVRMWFSTVYWRIKRTLSKLTTK